MNNDINIVKTKGLSKHFKSGGAIIKAVDDVSLDLPRGKLIVIKGASGSGKSTLLNLIGALDKPTVGTIDVDGVELSSIHGKEETNYRLRKVGFVFQSYYLVPGTTALENVMLPMGFLKIKNRDQKAKAIQLLNKVVLARRCISGVLPSSQVENSSV